MAIMIRYGEYAIRLVPADITVPNVARLWRPVQPSKGKEPMSISEQIEAAAPPRAAAAPKWAALVGDRLVPMPRRRLRARDILHQAGGPDGAVSAT